MSIRIPIAWFLASILAGALGCSGETEAPPPSEGPTSTGGGTPDDREDEGSTSAPLAVDVVETWLLGTFDSSVQAEEDARYFPVRLVTCRVDVPTLGERVLYVEQALLENPAAPYRQRLYVLEPGASPKSTAISRVFELTHPERFVGRCDGVPTRLTGEDAIEREGCRVELSMVDGHFEGTTPGTECQSDFQGAAFATSEVSLFADRIESWDRGYDVQGKQVWGAVAGPYVFRRQEP